MKLEFKFSLTNFAAFFVLGGLFYWLVPLPAAPVWRAVICAGVGLILFGICFVVVSHQRLIRPAAQEDLYKKRKRKK